MNDNYSKNSLVAGEVGQRAARGKRSSKAQRDTTVVVREVAKLQCGFSLELRKRVRAGSDEERRGWQFAVGRRRFLSLAQC